MITLSHINHHLD